VVSPLAVFPLGIPDHSSPKYVDGIAGLKVILRQFLKGMVTPTNTTVFQYGPDERLGLWWLQWLTHIRHP